MGDFTSIFSSSLARPGQLIGQLEVIQQRDVPEKDHLNESSDFRKQHYNGIPEVNALPEVPANS